MPARSLSRAALLPALLLLPAAVRAETRVMPCHLPADLRLLLSFEQQGWGRDGKPWQVNLVRGMRLSRDGLGFALTIDPARAVGKLDPAAQRRLAAVFDPAAQQSMTVRLDATGAVIGIDALEDHWRAYFGRIRQVTAAMTADGEQTQRAQAMVASLEKADRPTQLRLLVGDAAAPLLRLCGQSVEAETAADGLLAVSEDQDNEALRETTRYRVDGTSGLVRSIERRVTAKAQPDQPQLSVWRYEPQP